ncbi:MAG: diguanylate cyclase [Cognatishimia sp.]|uniref:diguanylate cyclase n=1 Tax=Cognatishimia sp. TaxID=2211648 RepID=UPI004058356B
MSGKLLIVDHETTSRTKMKVRLKGAFYDVLGAKNLGEARAVLDAERTDLVLMDARMPDEDPLRFCRNLRASPKTAHLPVLLVTTSNDRNYRIRALRAGADNVLVQPVDNEVLLPRLRSMMRRNEFNDPADLPNETVQALGLADAQTEFQTCASVLIASQDSPTAMLWKRLLSEKAPYDFTTQALGEALQSVTRAPAPDVFVIVPDASDPDTSLRLIAEIRARSVTRHSAVLVVLNSTTRDLQGDALDLGAQDVMVDGFDAEEMTLRISKIIQTKRLADRLRSNVRHGLQAAVTDPLTGLFNRRYAMTHLARIAEQAAIKDRSFAVMMVDLDRFKAVNDRYGHAAGDAVLAGAARRLRGSLRPVDLLARIGGEEFLIAMPDVAKSTAEKVAERICHDMRALPVNIPKLDLGVPVTVSVGLTMGGNHNLDRSLDALIQNADQALYQAKSAGRDQVLTV